LTDYLVRFSYTPETWRGWAENPIDRTPFIAAAVERLGGELKGFWLSFGQQDGFLLIAADEPVTPAALAVMDMGGGFLRNVETTVLLNVEEMLVALRRANELLTAES
jgi:uncharacterized protein with GYD domain